MNERTLELPRLPVRLDKDHGDPLAWSARVSASKPLLTDSEKEKANRTLPVTYREHTIALQYKNADSPYQHRPQTKSRHDQNKQTTAAAISTNTKPMVPPQNQVAVESKPIHSGNLLQAPKPSRTPSVVVFDGAGFGESATTSKPQKFLPPLPPPSPRDHTTSARKRMSIYTLDAHFGSDARDKEEEEMESIFIHEVAVIDATVNQKESNEECDSRPQSPSTYLFEWNMINKFADGPPSDNLLQELAKVLSQVITPVKVAHRNPRFQELQLHRQKEIWRKHWDTYQVNMQGKQGRFLENAEKRNRARHLNWKQQKLKARCMHWLVFGELQKFSFCIHDPLVRHRQNQSEQERRDRALIVLTHKFLPLWRRYRTRNERKSKRVLHRFFVRIFRESRFESKKRSLTLIFDFLKLLRTRNGVLLGIHMFVLKVKKIQRAWRSYWKAQKASVQLWMLQCEKYSSEFFSRMDMKTVNIPQVVLFQTVTPFRFNHRRQFIKSLVIYQNAIRAEAEEVAAFFDSPSDANRVRSKLEQVGRKPNYRHLLLKVDCHELLLQCLKGNGMLKRIGETSKKKKRASKPGKKKH